MTETRSLQDRLSSHRYETQHVIDGKLVAGEGDGLSVENPATEQIIAHFAQASAAQVETAAVSAKRAFDSGAMRNGADRKRWLARLADLIERDIEWFKTTLVEEVGTPSAIVGPLQMGVPLEVLRYFADQADVDRTRRLSPDGKAPLCESLVRYEPVGVVAAITAYNYPIVLAAVKIGAALAAGCTVVLMPSPQTPLATLRLGALALEAGFPAGALNVIVGGAEDARALTEHEAIDKISFTGSLEVGRHIMRQASHRITDTVLELGGKSAAIVLPDADIDAIAAPLHGRYLRNAGQGCQSPTRLLVPRSRIDEFLAASRKAYGSIPIGDPWNPATQIGPVISRAHRGRIEAYVERAVGSGAEILIGGGRPDFERGWYINATLVGGIDNSAEIARDELFGPVAVLLPYDSEDEAVAIANDSPFGLAGYVYGPTESAMNLGSRLRVGQLHINGGGALRVDSLHAGWKMSGVGSEYGEGGLMEFLEPQHVQWPI